MVEFEVAAGWEGFALLDAVPLKTCVHSAIGAIGERHTSCVIRLSAGVRNFPVTRLGRAFHSRRSNGPTGRIKAGAGRRGKGEIVENYVFLLMIDVQVLRWRRQIWIAEWNDECLRTQ